MEESPTAFLQRLFGMHPTDNLREMGEHQGGRTPFEWVSDEGARAPGQRGMRDRCRIRRKGFECESGGQSRRDTG